MPHDHLWYEGRYCDIACGAEMRLMQAVPDNTMMVSGYEHHTLLCMGCDEVGATPLYSPVEKQAETIATIGKKLAPRPQCIGIASQDSHIIETICLLRSGRNKLP